MIEDSGQQNQLTPSICVLIMTFKMFHANLFPTGQHLECHFTIHNIYFVSGYQIFWYHKIIINMIKDAK